MSKKIKIVPEFVFPIIFKKYGKKIKVDVKIFHNNSNLNKYYNHVVSKNYRDPYGILAGAIFNIPTTDNKNTIGEIIFSLDVLYPSIIAHEATHMAFQYFECERGLNFSNRRQEETFCSIIECITDGVYKYLRDNNIPFVSLPKWIK